jgi:lysophospholipase L1-like esterase
MRIQGCALKNPIKRLLPRAILALIGLLIGFFLVEGLLALLGFPAEIHEQVANPPNLRMWVDYEEFQYLWETNSQGLRYREVPLQKPFDTRRLFVVGDSQVDGEGVGAESRFTSLLEEELSAGDSEIQLINGGLGGQGVLQYARIFHWVGRMYEPDGLLICVNANDLSDIAPGTTTSEIYDYVKRPSGSVMTAFHVLWPRLWGRLRLAREGFSGEGGRLPEIGEFDLESLLEEAQARGISRRRVDSWRESLPHDWVVLAEQGKMSAYLLTWGLFRPDFYTTAIDINGPGAESRWKAQAAIIAEMAERARGEGIEVALVLLPNLYMYDPSAYRPGSTFPFHYLGGAVHERWALEETEIQRRLRGLTADLDLPFLDLTAGFREAGRGEEPLHFALDGHWNERGHRLAADLVAEWLERERIFTFLR